MAERGHGDALAQDSILAICAAPQSDHSEILGQLDSDAWAALAETAARTRTAPLVLQAIERADLKDKADSAALAALQDQARAHAISALQAGRDLDFILGLMENAQLSPIVLKGIALSFRDYPDPALRPLRDLDLLLSPKDALKAQDILLTHVDFRHLPGAGIYGLDYGHQLPEIQRVSSGWVIELHHRLDARGWDQEPVLVRSIFENSVRTPLLGRQVRVPSAEDNLLHLIEHATLHHLFDNGPLILADVHFLTSAHTLDWGRLMARAHGLGLSSALALVAALAKANGAQWMPEGLLTSNSVPDHHLKTAQAALFARQDATDRQKMLQRLAERSDGKMTWSAALGRIFRPDPTQLSLLSGHPPESAKRWLGYPKWLLNKASLFAGAKSSRGDLEAAKQRCELDDWLQKG